MQAEICGGLCFFLYSSRASHIVTVIVSLDTRKSDSFSAFQVDDGTDVVSCILWARPNYVAAKFSDASNTALALGKVVRVTGRVGTFRACRQLNVKYVGEFSVFTLFDVQLVFRSHHPSTHSLPLFEPP